MVILCCGASRITSSMSSKEATKIKPELTMRKGTSKIENIGVMIEGSIFLLEIKLMWDDFTSENIPEMSAQNMKDGIGLSIEDSWSNRDWIESAVAEDAGVMLKEII